MEPPTEVGGRTVMPAFTVSTPAALQWSRRPKSAEGGCFCLTEPGPLPERLQWSRRPKSAEGRARLMSDFTETHHASMEPPTEVGGRSGSWAITSASFAGFNGAADRSRRKAATHGARPATFGAPLQWSRRPKSAEGGTRPDWPRASMLCFNGAADRSRRKALRNLTWPSFAAISLQWSRRPKSAEGAMAPRGRSSSGPGFNGAADRSRRKVRAVEPSGGEVGPASMEPPTEVGGRIRDTGEDAMIRCRASMEPPTEVGGRLKRTAADDAWRLELQWSRRPKSAEGSARALPHDVHKLASMEPPTEVGGRSAATGVLMRRLAASMEPPTEVGGRGERRADVLGCAAVLQWSRRPKSAEGRDARRPRCARHHRASMEPPTEVGGRAPAAAPASWWASSFNGAADRSRRKAQRGGRQRTRGCCGFNGAADRSRRKGHPAVRPELHLRRFNGAADRSRRKVGTRSEP